MPRPTALTQEELQEQLHAHPMWRLSEVGVQPQRIIREVQSADWMSALGLVNAIAILADTMDHHPDILLYGWNKIRISVSTHDQGALTVLDFALASKIDDIALKSLEKDR